MTANPPLTDAELKARIVIIAACSYCGFTDQSPYRTDGKTVVCDSCFERWRFIGPTADEDRAKWIVAPRLLDEVKALRGENAALKSAGKEDDVVIAKLEAANDADREVIVGLREALTAVRDHPHCSYDHPSNQGGSHGYSTGVVDGHRCAANVARAALAKVEGGERR